jgi:hypothetical protein
MSGEMVMMQLKNAAKYYPRITRITENAIFLDDFVLPIEMDDLRRTA